MGVLNVTPDSFSDGGRYLDLDRAVAHGERMIEQGAAIVDVGGESTRPGAAPVDAAEERRRVVPVVEALAGRVRVSVDTSKAEALPGVKAVVTAADIVDFPVDTPYPLGIQDMRWMCRNVMARERALWHGHAVAAVAAMSEAIAEEACALIEVEYEVLPHAIEIDDALAEDAPILHPWMEFEGKPSNIAGTLEHTKGDVEAGFAEAGRRRARAAG